MTGIAFAIVASLGWGTGAVFARYGLQGMKASTGTLISILASAILVCSLALIIDFDVVLALTPVAVLWFSIAGLIAFVLGRQLNFMAIRYLGVGKATPITASAPLFAIIIAVTFTEEYVNLPIVAGTIFVVTGLYLVITSR